MPIAITILLIGLFLGWYVHDYWKKPSTKSTETPTVRPAVLPPIMVQAPTRVLLKLPNPESKLLPQTTDAIMEEGNSVSVLVEQSKADIQRGEYLSAIHIIEQILAQVQAKYSQEALEQLLIEASNLYLQQLADTDAITKRDFLFRITELVPNYLQFRYLLGELLITLEDYEGASYQLSFLVNHTRWKKQFDALEKALNYAKTFQLGDVEIPLIRKINAWHVTANIDGKPATLILDTGASITTLGKHLIADDYEPVGKVVLSTANGKIEAFRVNLKTLLIGDISKHNFPVVVLPKAKLPTNIDGLLGLDWLSAFHFVIDEKNAILRLTQR